MAKKTPNQRHEVNRAEFKIWKERIVKLEQVTKALKRALSRV